MSVSRDDATLPWVGQNQNNSALQTRQGFFWIGTNTAENEA